LNQGSGSNKRIVDILKFLV